MAVLTIRNLPDEIRTRLRVRASKNGRSMEAEARAILSGAVNAPPPGDLRETIDRVQALVAAAGKKGASKGKAGRQQANSVDAFLRDRRREAILEAIRDGFNPRELYRSEYTRIAAEAGWKTNYIDQLAKTAAKP